MKSPIPWTKTSLLLAAMAYALPAGAQLWDDESAQEEPIALSCDESTLAENRARLSDLIDQLQEQITGNTASYSAALTQRDALNASIQDNLRSSDAEIRPILKEISRLRSESGRVDPVTENGRLAVEGYEDSIAALNAKIAGIRAAVEKLNAQLSETLLLFNKELASLTEGKADLSDQLEAFKSQAEYLRGCAD